MTESAEKLKIALEEFKNEILNDRLIKAIFNFAKKICDRLKLC